MHYKISHLNACDACHLPTVSHFSHRTEPNRQCLSHMRSLYDHWAPCTRFLIVQYTYIRRSTLGQLMPSSSNSSANCFGIVRTSSIMQNKCIFRQTSTDDSNKNIILFSRTHIDIWKRLLCIALSRCFNSIELRRSGEKKIPEEKRHNLISINQQNAANNDKRWCLEEHRGKCW